MRFKLFLATLLAWAGVVGVLALAAEQSGAAKPLKFEVQLLWGTNDPQSPDPKHKPVDSEVAKKLKQLPLKWSNYFVVNKKSLEMTVGAEKKEPLSEKCAIEVKDLGKSLFEITLFGKGEKVVKRTQSLPVGEILVLGGNAPGETSWLVVIKRVQ
jgi:hypothetical protein